MNQINVLIVNCPKCQYEISFSSSEIDNLSCNSCGSSLPISKNKNELIQFERLCNEIVQSRGILSYASVGVDVDGKKVAIPLNLLLSRLFATIDLTSKEHSFSVDFRRTCDETGGIPNEGKIEIQFMTDKVSVN